MAFSSALREFWHAMTSNDRHSTYDSPYRTGRHVPLPTGRSSILTSVATASDSRADITSPYRDGAATSTADLNALPPYSPATPGHNTPYSPGLRSQTAQATGRGDGFEMQSPGEIPMQSFQDGVPPPPPVSHSWKRIDNWAEEQYPELFDQLGEGATKNDLNDLEHQLDCSLPMDVRESLMAHDGQERGGRPTGIIFSAMLLDCEEIVQEWNNWRVVNQEILERAGPPEPVASPTLPENAADTSAPADGAQASSSRNAPSPTPSVNATWRQDLLARQDCCPPNSVRSAYAHPAWIPLVRDWGGNNLAVDLAPGPAGQWGQVILFGRDYDTKYVVARSWATFMAMVADDLGSGKWSIDEDSGELKLREFKSSRVEPGYFDILRWRMDQKYGRRAAKRRTVVPSPREGSPTASSPTASPYTSPLDGADRRGRSLQRPGGNSPLVSPHRPPFGKPSPLARVTEESTSALLSTEGLMPPNLVEFETTPRPSEDKGGSAPTPGAGLDSPEANRSKGKVVLAESTPTSSKMNGKQPEVDDGAMKTIEI